MSHSNATQVNEKIAIIGMHGRFPGAGSLDEYWKLLRDGRCGLTRFNRDELVAEGIPADLIDSPDYVPVKGILEETACFDGAFFGYSPREAASMDPQHRHFLESVWLAIEDAGYQPDAVPGRTAIFGGARLSTYGFGRFAHAPDLTLVNDPIFLVENSGDYLTSRISHRLGMTGPSVNVQSACSTGLVSVAMAVDSLLSYQADSAIAGGVRISVPVRSGYQYTDEGIMSPDGVCRTFDRNAAGTVFSDGVGAVYLKRLEDALRDRDPIRAVILGTAINNDGSNRAAYTAPGLAGQVDVISAALALAGVDSRSVSYLECHGTGTRLGDVVEVQAARRAFEAFGPDRGYCRMGSVKPSIGHTSQAAGIASLIKTVLALEHRCLPKSINIQTVNPELDLDNSPFRVNQETCDWMPIDGVRRACISSFGLGGTNAHLVLEEAPPATEPAPEPPYVVLPLSARTEENHVAMRTALTRHLASEALTSAGDVAFTLGEGRRAEAVRSAAVVPGRDGVTRLEEISFSSPIAAPAPRFLVFLFPGQGSDRPGTGCDLYERSAPFRQTVDRGLEALRRLADEIPEWRWLFAEDDSLDCTKRSTGLRAISSESADTQHVQPLTVILQVATAQHFMALGLRPDRLAGHSLGDVSALCVAEVLSLEDAVKIAFVRGQAMSRHGAGRMVALFGATEAQAAELGVEHAVEIAAVNGPGLVVMSGREAAIESLCETLDARTISHRRLPARYAFHSAAMDPVVKELTVAFRSVSLAAPRIEVVFSMTGAPLDAAQATAPEFLARQARNSVRFGESIERLTAMSSAVLDLGSRPVLRDILLNIRAISAEAAVAAFDQEVSDEMRGSYQALANLWRAGVSVDWVALSAGRVARRLRLPGYCFSRDRHWLQAKCSAFPTASVETPAATPVTAREPFETWFHTTQWSEFIPVPPTLSEVPGQWLVIGTDGDLKSLVCRMLEAEAGDNPPRIRSVTFGDKTSSDAPNAVGGPIDDEAWLDAVFEGAKPNDGRRLGVFWCVDRCAIGTAETFAADTFFPLVLAVRALGRLNTPARLVIVTKAGLTPDEQKGEDLDPFTASFAGAVSVIQQEAESVSCLLIDLPDPKAAIIATAMKSLRPLQDLIAGCQSGVFTVRSDTILKRGFEPIRFSSVLRPRELSRDGAWIITGGFGAIGLAAAEQIAECGGSDIVLIGRSDFPDETGWQALAEDTEAAATRRSAARRLLALKHAGARLYVRQLDVANPQAVRHAVARIVEDVGPIRGIIHAAGVPSARLMDALTLEDVRRVFGPKIVGTAALLEALDLDALDHVVLCSSRNSVFGRFGQLDYCVANAFLDACAQALRRRGVSGAVSIGWDVWADAGMAVNTALEDVVHAWRADSLNRGIHWQEGRRVIQLVLTDEAPAHLIISTSPHPTNIDRHDHLEAQRLKEMLSNVVASKPKRVAKPRSDQEDPQGETEVWIADLWSELLGVESIGRHDSFFDLGGHSLTATMFIARLRRQRGQQLRLREFFDNPTVSMLATALLAPAEVGGRALHLNPIQTIAAGLARH